MVKLWMLRYTCRCRSAWQYWIWKNQRILTELYMLARSLHGRILGCVLAISTVILADWMDFVDFPALFRRIYTWSQPGMTQLGRPSGFKRLQFVRRVNCKKSAVVTDGPWCGVPGAQILRCWDKYFVKPEETNGLGPLDLHQYAL